ncbi:MAG: hypothetical protein HY042_04170 [Spirochaetia bacterium]|nr:hypothetical protein [Spirochaetia bacterium]
MPPYFVIVIRLWKDLRTRFGKKPILILALVPVLAATFTIVYAAKRERGTRVSPKKGPIVEAIYALGTVKADATYTLKVGVAMSVLNVPVMEGDVIGRGAPLLTTDTATFTSPIAGTVTRVSVQKGETVMPGGGVITVMDLTRKYVQVSLDQQSALLVRVG